MRVGSYLWSGLTSYSDAVVGVDAPELTSVGALLTMLSWTKREWLELRSPCTPSSWPGSKGWSVEVGRNKTGFWTLLKSRYPLWGAKRSICRWPNRLNIHLVIVGLMNHSLVSFHLDRASALRFRISRDRQESESPWFVQYNRISIVNLFKCVERAPPSLERWAVAMMLSK